MVRQTVKQIAEQYGLSRAIIYLWVEERRFPVYRIGGQGRRGRILIDADTFTAFMDGLMVEAGPTQPTGPLKHIRPKP